MNVEKLSDTFIEVAQSIDQIHQCADKFVDKLEDRTRREGLMGTGCSNVELLCQRLMDLYGPAIEFLMAVKACYENKKHAVNNVNDYLHAIMKEVGLLCKVTNKRPKLLSVDSYKKNVEEKLYSSNEEYSGRGCKVMENSVMLLTMPSELKETVDGLKSQVSKVVEDVKKLSLEKSAKELRLLKSGDTQEKPLIHYECEKESVQEQTALNEETKDFPLMTSQVTEKERGDVRELRNTIDTLQQEIKAVQSQLDQVNIEKDTLITEMQGRMANIERETKVAREEAKECEEKLNSFEKLQQENEAMKAELEIYKRKKILQVQLYSQTRGSLLTEILDELQALLRSKINSSSTEVEFIKCLQPNDIQRDKPVLIICIHTSRLGTDTSSALSGMPVSPGMALLVVHHKDKHALPNQSSDRVLTGTKFSSLGGIFDLAFLSEKGIYDCEMNDHTVTDLINFIRKRITDSTENN